MQKRGLRAGDDVEWAVGYTDFYHGFTKEQCPYDDKTQERNRWKNGFEFAEKEHQKCQTSRTGGS
jgi:ribosome modulation factor